jgi:hypothetical protein
MEETRNAYTEFLWGNVFGRRPFAKQRRRLKDNIKMNLRYFGCEDVRWVELVQNHI